MSQRQDHHYRVKVYSPAEGIGEIDEFEAPNLFAVRSILNMRHYPPELEPREGWIATVYRPNGRRPLAEYRPHIRRNQWVRSS